MSKCNICGAPIFADEPVTNQPCLDCIMEPLPDLIDKAVTMLLRADGDRDHMNHSDINCEQSMAVVEILRMCKSATNRYVTPKMIEYALDAWFASPPSESDMGLERSMRAAIEAALSTVSRGVRDMRAEANQHEMAEGTRCDGSCNDGLPCHCGPLRPSPAVSRPHSNTPEK